MSDDNKSKQRNPKEHVNSGKVCEKTDDSDCTEIDLSILEDIAFSDFKRRAPETLASVKSTS